MRKESKARCACTLLSSEYALKDGSGWFYLMEIKVLSVFITAGNAVHKPLSAIHVITI
jgi:hypothetical protein